MINVGSFYKSKVLGSFVCFVLLSLIISCPSYGLSEGYDATSVNVAEDGKKYVSCEIDISNANFDKSKYSDAVNFLSYNDYNNGNALFVQVITNHDTDEGIKDVCVSRYASNDCKKNCDTINCINKCGNDANCVSECKICESQCYNDNDICKTYINDTNTHYFKVEGTKIDGDDSKGYFYLFTKNMKPLGIGETPTKGEVYNCLLKKYSCDFNPGYKFKDYNNVIISGVNDAEFNEIVNGYLGNYELFKKVGECSDYSSCEKIMKDDRYFKKLTGINGKVEYYVKNINSATCNNYLPACKEVINDVSGLFNKDSKGETKANLEALKNASGKNCLDSDDIKLSYCSDINITYNDNGTINKEVKYENGLEYDKDNKPSCLLKSCIDLTKEEIEINENKSKGRKYCSEFIWLRNGSRLKYFPKSNPIYCSDIEEGKLKFLEGINKNKDNCYLKRCISLTTDERRKVAEQNMLNVFNKIGTYADDSLPNIDTVKDGLPKYCENQIFLVYDKIDDKSKNKSLIEKVEFNDLKLNILPCADFSNRANLITNGIINFKDIFFGTSSTYDINNNTKLCRNAITPIYNKDGINDMNYSYLCSVFITKNEDKANSNENSQFKDDNIEKICDSYGKIRITSIEDDDEAKNYDNIVKSVDNTIAFLNADILDIRNLDINNDKFEDSVCKKYYKDEKKKNEYYYKYCKASDYVEPTGKCNDNKYVKDYDNECWDEKGENKCKCETETLTSDYKKTLIPSNILSVYKNSGISNKFQKIDTTTSNNYQKCLQLNGYDDSKCEEEKKNYDEYKKDNVFYIYDYFVNFKDYRPNASSNQERVSLYDTSYFDCYLYEKSGLISDKYENLRKYIWEECKNEFEVEEDNGESIVNSSVSGSYSPKPLVNEGTNTILSTLATASDGGRGLSKKDASKYGCYYIDNQGHNEKFCKITSDDSLFINTFSTKSENINAPYKVTANMSVCLRHSDSPWSKNSPCGRRQKGKFADKCIALDVVSMNDDKTLNFETSYSFRGRDSGDTRTYIHDSDYGKFYAKNYSNALNSNYFRTDRYGRNIYTFYDFLTNFNCLAENRTLIDKVTVTLILGRCFVMTVAIPWPWSIPAFAGCVAYGIETEAKMSLSNDLYFVRDYSAYMNVEDKAYNGTGTGFYTNANITDNNNMLYNYYKRSDNLFEDLKSKIELANQYYDDKNVLSKHIIDKCNLKNLVKPNSGGDRISYSVTSFINCKNTDNCSETCSKDNIYECLNEEQKKCLNGYGVHFFSNGMGFGTANGKTFLKRYKDGYYVQKMYYNENSGYGVIPLNIARFASNAIIADNNADCKLDKYGNPIGDLTHCRGYYYENSEQKKIFVKESQASKLALQTSPQMFFNLANPRNTPDLYNPNLSLIGYYDYTNNEKMEDYEGKDFLLDFFEPKLVFKYDFPENNNDLANSITKTCEFNSGIDDSCRTIKVKIDSDKNKSSVKKVSYSIKGSTYEQEYYFILSKESSLDGSNVETPKVCLHQLTKIDIGITAGVCYVDDGTNCWVIKDKNVFCYDRKYPNIEDIKIKPSNIFNYKKPYINVAITNNDKINFFDDPKYYYSSLTNEDGDERNFEYSGKNNIQNSTLGFERSDCSKLEIDYYKYKALLSNSNLSLRERKFYNSSIDGIETKIASDCKLQNGNPFYALDLDKDGYVENKYEVKNNGYSNYGGFNEICLLDRYVKKISSDFPKILAYKNENGVDGKCFLDKISRGKSSCLIANKVYAVCDINDTTCEFKTSSLTGEQIRVRGIDCISVLNNTNNKDFDELTEDDIFKIKLCYKGGYNSYGNIYKADGTKDYSCSCVASNNVNIPEMYENIFEFRTPTTRELSLCADLIDSPKCEAVKYYNYSGDYYSSNNAVREVSFVQDKLCYPNMSCTTTQQPNASQHLWRSSEKLFGTMKPFSKNVTTLGHAEFESSLYCLDDNGNETDLCIGGQKEVQGKCNGYWKNKDDGNGVFAVCQKDGKGGYEYKLVDSEQCVRYECQDVFYDSTKKMEILDEEKIDTNTGESIILFDNSENNSFDIIDVNNIRTFNHNEEANINNVDKRGLKQSYASWKGIESSDVVKPQIANSCLTGYGVATSNYVREYETDFSDIDKLYNINYEILADKGSKSDAEKRKFVEVLKRQISKFKQIQDNNLEYLPKRYCDQLGNWLSARDIYSNVEDKNLLYYTNNSNWNSVLKSGNKFVDFISKIRSTSDEVYNLNTEGIFEKGYISESDKNRYCERLFCPDISINKYAKNDTKNDGLNYDIYKYEYGNDTYRSNNNEKSINKNTSWKHTGGASWTNISASRNDSSNVDINKLNDTFSDPNDDNAILSKYKYLKKVYGQCQTEYGYYARGTKFINGFEEQFKKINSEYINKNVKGGIDPRELELNGNSDAEKENLSKPIRTCNSVGLWSGVANGCFRSCEMMDMYHTKTVDGLDNLNSNITIKNSDILAIYKDVDVSVDEKKNRFKQSNEYDRGNYVYGDYLTGGARWARSVVTVDSPKDNTTGLRYIEVEGECDSTFDDDINTTQYVVNIDNKKPIRRCYEDGTWGPVVGDTRCVTFKTCVKLNMTPTDLADIITMYRNNKSTYDISKELNKKARENLTSYNVMMSFSASSINLDYIKNNGINRVKFNAAEENYKQDSYLICNLTSENGNITNGWIIEDQDIGEYFVPKTCSKVEYDDANANKVRNRLVKKSIVDELKDTEGMYTKESLLSETYNVLNNKTNETFGNTINALKKDVVIGTKTYLSYQNETKCDESNFYNVYLDKYDKSEKTDRKDYNDEYKVLYECKSDGDLKKKIDFITDEDWKNTKNLPQILSPYNCKVKQCGGLGGLQENWGKHVENKDFEYKSVGIYEVAKNRDKYGYENSKNRYYNEVNSIDTHVSLRCPSGFAFVFGKNTINDNGMKTKDGTNVLTYYTNDKGVNEAQSMSSNWVVAINADCESNDSFDTVNGVNYDYAYKYGNISSGLFGKDGKINLCRDAAGTDCKDINIKDTFDKNFLNDSQASGNSGYCVYMGCRVTKLGIDGSRFPYAPKENITIGFGERFLIGGKPKLSYSLDENTLCNGGKCDASQNLCGPDGDQYTDGKQEVINFQNFLFTDNGLKYSSCSSYVNDIKDVKCSGNSTPTIETTSTYDFIEKLKDISYLDDTKNKCYSKPNDKPTDSEITAVFDKNIISFVLERKSNEINEKIKTEYKEEIKQKLEDKIKKADNSTKKDFYAYDNLIEIDISNDEAYKKYVDLDYNKKYEYYSNGVKNSYFKLPIDCDKTETRIEKTTNETTNEVENNEVTYTCVGYYMTVDNFESLYKQTVDKIVSSVRADLRDGIFDSDSKITFENIKALYNSIDNACYSIDKLFDIYNNDTSYNDDDSLKDGIINTVRSLDSNGVCNYNDDLKYFKQVYIMKNFIKKGNDCSTNYKKFLNNEEEYFSSLSSERKDNDYEIFLREDGSNNEIYICGTIGFVETINTEETGNTEETNKDTKVITYYRCIATNINQLEQNQSIKCISVEKEEKDDVTSETRTYDGVSCRRYKTLGEDGNESYILLVGNKGREFTNTIFNNFLDKNGFKYDYTVESETGTKIETVEKTSYLTDIKNNYENINNDCLSNAKNEFIKDYCARANDNSAFKQGFYTIFKCGFDGKVTNESKSTCKPRCQRSNESWTTILKEDMHTNPCRCNCFKGLKTGDKWWYSSVEDNKKPSNPPTSSVSYGYSFCTKVHTKANRGCWKRDKAFDGVSCYKCNGSGSFVRTKLECKWHDKC